jgi:uncharacterized protein YndB with AHSA1/START domain
VSASTNRVVLALPRDVAFAVICDAAQYPRWLVGAHTIRQVDHDWPAVGQRFTHRIGVGAMSVPGTTTVRRIDPPRLLELGAGMGVLGEATVRFELTPVADGTEVRMLESPSRGLARIAHRLLSPVVRVALWGRNQVSLVELKEIAGSLAATQTGAAVAAGGDLVRADDEAISVEGPNSL